MIKQTEIFSKWLLKLKDTKAKVAILRRIQRVQEGNFGDYKTISSEISELRITTGPGYRVYYTKRNEEIVILLIAGDKSTQTEDILKAKKIAEELKDDKINNIRCISIFRFQRDDCRVPLWSTSRW